MKNAPETTSKQSPWMTAREVADYLSVRPSTILKWAKTGIIPGHKLSGQERITWRFRKVEVDAILEPASAAGFGGILEKQQI